MSRILMVVGSTHENGFNEQLARKAAAALEGKAEVSFLNYADVPMFNQSLENPVLDSVARVRKEVAEADGVWFFAPMYNNSYPAVLKNIIDWISRPEPGKSLQESLTSGLKVTISSASSKPGKSGVVEKLEDLLTFIGTDLMKEPLAGIAIPGESWGTGELVLSAEDQALLEAQANAFVEFVK